MKSTLLLTPVLLTALASFVVVLALREAPRWSKQSDGGKWCVTDGSTRYGFDDEAEAGFYAHLLNES